MPEDIVNADFELFLFFSVQEILGIFSKQEMFPFKS